MTVGRIDKRVSVDGDISFAKGSFFIHGEFKGTIKSPEGTLFLEETSVVDAKIHVKHVVFKGKFIGACECNLLEMKDKSSAKADILCGSLSIQEGALFEGTCEIAEKWATVD